MSAPSIASQAPFASGPQGTECRVYERHACGLPTTCQPIAARSDRDIVWPALIRDVSEGGLGIVLGRRFERGAGLAIELPQTGGRPAETLLAKVIHTTSLPGNRWLLGCAFISRLSDEEVRLVVGLAEALNRSARPARPAPSAMEETGPPPPRASGPAQVVISDLWFEGTTRAGRTVRLPVRRLFLTGAWPLAVDTVLRLWVADKNQHPAGTRVQVTQCRHHGDYWTVTYRPLDSISDETLRALGFAG